MIKQGWRDPARVRVATLACLGLAMLYVGCAFKPVIEGDGVSYYAYLHALIIDHGLNVGPVYEAAHRTGVTTWPGLVDVKTPTGMRADFYPIGSALLGLPAYLIALALHPTGEPQFGPPFTTAWVVASLLCGLCALALTFRMARSLSGAAGAALLAMITVALATSFVYYLLYEPSYSHMFTVFAMTLFVLAWWKRPEARSAKWWFLVGVLAGLLTLCRWQFGPIVAITLLDWKRARWRLGLVALGYALVLAPQLWVDRVMFGTWLPLRPEGQAIQSWPGHYLDILVSSWHGLFIWAPVVIMALLGALFIPDRRFQLALAYAFLLEVVINGAVPDWWGGFSFGPRRFIELTPFFGVALACLAVRMRPWVAGAGAAILSAWNLLLISNFTYVIAADHDTGYWRLIAGQLSAVHYLPRLFVQGGVVRALVFRHVVPNAPSVATGLALLALEVTVVAIAVAVAGWHRGEGGQSVIEPALVPADAR